MYVCMNVCFINFVKNTYCFNQVKCCLTYSSVCDVCSFRRHNTLQIHYKKCYQRSEVFRRLLVYTIYAGIRNFI